MNYKEITTVLYDAYLYFFLFYLFLKSSSYFVLLLLANYYKNVLKSIFVLKLQVVF